MTSLARFALRSLGLCLLITAGACGDSSSSSSDVVVTYDDGTSTRLATDSAVFTINSDSSLIARAYLPARGPVPAFTLELSVDSLGGLSLPPGVYDVSTGLPLSFAAALRNSSLIAAPTSGTVTITSSSSSAVSGTLDMAFAYIQFPDASPAPFTLTGRFRFTDTDAAPAQ